MAPFRDLSGLRFGRFLVQDRAGLSAHKKALWNVDCDCGERRIVVGGNLTSGMSQSCGCLNTKHGMSRKSIYKVWQGMLSRCYQPAHASYKDYGGRGIRVCKRWRRSFTNFLADMVDSYKCGLSIDRLNNSKGYTPSNCAWSTAKEQVRNRRNNRIIDTPLGRMCIGEAAEKSGLNWQTIHYRVKANWPTEKLFNPSRRA